MLKALCPNQRHVFSRFRQPSCQSLPIVSHVILLRSSHAGLLHGAHSVYFVSADVSQAWCTTEITSRKALEGRGYAESHNSVRHSLRCCYCDRIIYSFHISFWYFGGCCEFQDSFQPYLGHVSDRSKDKKFVVRDSSTVAGVFLSKALPLHSLEAQPSLHSRLIKRWVIVENRERRFSWCGHTGKRTTYGESSSHKSSSRPGCGLGLKRRESGQSREECLAGHSAV